MFLGLLRLLEELRVSILHHVLAFAPKKNVQAHHHQHGAHHTKEEEKEVRFSLRIKKWFFVEEDDGEVIEQVEEFTFQDEAARASMVYQSCPTLSVPEG